MAKYNSGCLLYPPKKKRFGVEREKVPFTLIKGVSGV